MEKSEQKTIVAVDDGTTYWTTEYDLLAGWLSEHGSHRGEYSRTFNWQTDLWHLPDDSYSELLCNEIPGEDATYEEAGNIADAWFCWVPDKQLWELSLSTSADEDMATEKEYPIAGKLYDWETIVHSMNDTIREIVHHELAPCSRQAFLDAYMVLHEESGEEFEIS